MGNSSNTDRDGLERGPTHDATGYGYSSQFGRDFEPRQFEGQYVMDGPLRPKTFSELNNEREFSSGSPFPFRSEDRPASRWNESILGSSLTPFAEDRFTDFNQRDFPRGSSIRHRHEVPPGGYADRIFSGSLDSPLSARRTVLNDYASNEKSWSVEAQLWRPQQDFSSAFPASPLDPLYPTYGSSISAPVRSSSLDMMYPTLQNDSSIRAPRPPPSHDSLYPTWRNDSSNRTFLPPSWNPQLNSVDSFYPRYDSLDIRPSLLGTENLSLSSGAPMTVIEGQTTFEGSQFSPLFTSASPVQRLDSFSLSNNMPLGSPTTLRGSSAAMLNGTATMSLGSQTMTMPATTMPLGSQTMTLPAITGMERSPRFTGNGMPANGYSVGIQSTPLQTGSLAMSGLLGNTSMPLGSQTIMMPATSPNVTSAGFMNGMPATLNPGIQMVGSQAMNGSSAFMGNGMLPTSTAGIQTMGSQAQMVGSQAMNGTSLNFMGNGMLASPTAGIQTMGSQSMANSTSVRMNVLDQNEQESDLMERLKDGVFLGSGAAAGVQLVSLGASCGPKLSFKEIGRGAETLPFDWARTKIEALLHFISNDFVGYYDAPSYTSYPDERGVIWKAHRSRFHSFWHDDPSTPAMREKYDRRIKRFLNINARTQPVLFVRSIATTSEIPRIPELVHLLMRKFGPNAKLLVVVEFQGRGAFGPCAISGLNNLLLWSFDTERATSTTAPHGELVKKAMDWASGLPLQTQQFPNMQAFQARLQPTDWGLYGAAGVPAFV